MNRAEQPAREQLTSFDTLASIDLLRFDLQRLGQVSPETRQRVYDDELSSFAEGVDRAAYTTFVLPRQEGQLVYRAQGGLRPYGLMLADGLQAAQNDARRDYRKEFQVDWARRDQLIGRQMNMLRPGQRLVWRNGYPHDIEARYGADFLKQCGLSPDRQMGFIYVATCLEDGSVQLESQTVDHSDADAFAAVGRMSEYDPEADMDTFVRAYDGTLRQKYGGHFYAGRRRSERGENAWDEITRHRDLITYFLDGLEWLAALDIPRDQLRGQVEAHTYGVWKAFKNRLQATQPSGLALPTGGPVPDGAIIQEVTQAFQQARAEGDIKIGCGGAIALGPNAPTDPLSTFGSIFGTKREKIEYKFDKHMYCVVCQAPPTKAEQQHKSKKLCGPCGICKGCDTELRVKEKGSALLSTSSL